MIAGEYTTRGHWAIFLGRAHWDPESLGIDHIPKRWNMIGMTGAKMTRSMVLCPILPSPYPNDSKCFPGPVKVWQRSNAVWHLHVHIIPYLYIYSITYPYHRISSIIIPYLCAWIGHESLWHEQHDPPEDHNWQLAIGARDDSITSHRIGYGSNQKNHLQPPQTNIIYSYVHIKSYEYISIY